MKRLRRWIFNVAAAVSLMLCLATAGLWARSHFGQAARDEIYFVNDRTYCITSDAGLTMFSDFAGRTPGEPDGYGFHIVRGERFFLCFALIKEGILFDKGHMTSAGFGAVSFSQTNGDGNTIGLRAVMAPDWFLLIVFLLLPRWAAIRIFRWAKRRGTGLCENCGYDLRATPNRCPECGKIAANNKTVAT